MQIDSKTGAWIHADDSEYTGHIYDPKMSQFLISLTKEVNPKIIYDFGCGFGEYLRDIRAEVGIKGIGFELYPYTKYYSLIVSKDLSKPLDLKAKADISISLEVGEHIDSSYEDIFIKNITNNTANIVVLSWAIPGQGGDGHINCRDNDYIIEKMRQEGFEFDEKFLAKRNEFTNWFKNSLMLFRKK